MQVHIFISVVGRDGYYFGHISGEIEIPYIPRPGDEVKLFGDKYPPDSLADLTVKKLTVVAGKYGHVSLMLTDVVAESVSDARAAVAYMTNNFGLVFESDSGVIS